MLELNAELREDGSLELREDGSVELREGPVPTQPPGGFVGRPTISVPLPRRRPWESPRRRDARAEGAVLEIGVELVPGTARVLNVELQAGSARGQIIYDRAVIDADLLAIADL